MVEFLRIGSQDADVLPIGIESQKASQQASQSRARHKVSQGDIRR